MTYLDLHAVFSNIPKINGIQRKLTKTLGKVERLKTGKERF
jgi:hypothetical protein